MSHVTLLVIWPLATFFQQKWNNHISFICCLRDGLTFIFIYLWVPSTQRFRASVNGDCKWIGTETYWCLAGVILQLERMQKSLPVKGIDFNEWSECFSIKRLRRNRWDIHSNGDADYKLSNLYDTCHNSAIWTLMLSSLINYYDKKSLQKGAT